MFLANDEYVALYYFTFANNVALVFFPFFKHFCIENWQTHSKVKRSFLLRSMWINIPIRPPSVKFIPGSRWKSDRSSHGCQYDTTSQTLLRTHAGIVPTTYKSMCSHRFCFFFPGHPRDAHELGGALNLPVFDHQKPLLHPQSSVRYQLAMPHPSIHLK